MSEINKNSKDKSVQKLLKAADVAEYLNISRAMAYRLMQIGEIPCVRIGAAKRVRPHDLQDFVEQNLSPLPSLK